MTHLSVAVDVTVFVTVAIAVTVTITVTVTISVAISTESEIIVIKHWVVTTAESAERASPSAATAAKTTETTERVYGWWHERRIRVRGGPVPRNATPATVDDSGTRVWEHGSLVGIVTGTANRPPAGRVSGRGGQQQLFASQQPLEQAVDEGRVHQTDAHTEVHAQRVRPFLIDGLSVLGCRLFLLRLPEHAAPCQHGL